MLLEKNRKNSHLIWPHPIKFMPCVLYSRCIRRSFTNGSVVDGSIKLWGAILVPRPEVPVHNFVSGCGEFQNILRSWFVRSLPATIRPMFSRAFSTHMRFVAVIIRALVVIIHKANVLWEVWWGLILASAKVAPLPAAGRPNLLVADHSFGEGSSWAELNCVSIWGYYWIWGKPWCVSRQVFIHDGPIILYSPDIKELAGM